VLQAASFSDTDKAAHLHAALLARGYPSFVETACLRNNTTWHRVRVGYYSDLQAAQEARAQIKKDFNLDPLVLR
jgi:cell division septation protein DedD